MFFTHNGLERRLFESPWFIRLFLGKKKFKLAENGL